MTLHRKQSKRSSSLQQEQQEKEEEKEKKEEQEEDEEEESVPLVGTRPSTSAVEQKHSLKTELDELERDPEAASLSS